MNVNVPAPIVEVAEDVESSPRQQTPDFRIELIGRLNGQKRAIAERIHRRKSEAEIGWQLGMGENLVIKLREEIYSNLQFDSSIPLHDRQAYVGRLYGLWLDSQQADSKVLIVDGKNPEQTMIDAKAAITAIGVDIDAQIRLLSLAPDLQLKTVAGLVHGFHEHKIADECVEKPVAIVRKMLDLLYVGQKIPTEWDVEKKQKFLRAVGLWAVKKYEMSVTEFQQVFHSPDEKGEKGGDGESLLSEPELGRLVAVLDGLPTRVKQTLRCVTYGLDIKAEMSKADQNPLRARLLRSTSQKRPP